MPQPLTELENQAVQRLLARIKFAMEIQSGDVEALDTPVPLDPPPMAFPTNGNWLRDAADLAKAGAHHLAINAFRDSLLQDLDPHASLSIAISALLWEEREVAEEWALRALQMIEVEVATGNEVPARRASEMEILSLAKVFRALGKTEEELTLRERLNEKMHQFKGQRDPGILALRLAVELGYEPESEVLALKLPPLVIGHSRGNLTRNLYRTLLSKGKTLLAWALFAMTTAQHEEAALRDAAIEAACEMDNFDLALKFAANDGYVQKEDSSLLLTIARWLIAQRRPDDWRGIWHMLTDEQSVHKIRFSVEKRLGFLATIVEHVAPADRATIFKISNRYHRFRSPSTNKELDQEIANMHLVIAAWGASKATVRKLVKEAKIPKFRIASVVRAAEERDLPCLLPLVPEARSKFLNEDLIPHLSIEWEKFRRGKRNRLEKVFQNYLQKALAADDHWLLFNILRFVGNTWKDLDRYRELLGKYRSPTGLSITQLYPLILPLIKTGNLIALEAELANYTDAHCLAEAGSVLLTCLKNRFGLQQQLEDF